MLRSRPSRPGPSLSSLPPRGGGSGWGSTSASSLDGRKAMSTADPNLVIVTGENPFIRLSAKDSDEYTTNASFWRILFSPAGPGHVLYLKSELTENRWRIWSDNIAMARWLQTTVQGMLNAELRTPPSPSPMPSSASPATRATSGPSGRCARARTSPSPGTTSAIPCSSTRSPTRSGPPLRRVHGPDSGPRRAPDAQRHRGRGQPWPRDARAGPSAPARWRSPRAGLNPDKAFACQKNLLDRTCPLRSTVTV